MNRSQVLRQKIGTTPALQPKRMQHSLGGNTSCIVLPAVARKHRCRPKCRWPFVAEDSVNLLSANSFRHEMGDADCMGEGSLVGPKNSPRAKTLEVRSSGKLLISARFRI